MISRVRSIIKKRAFQNGIWMYLLQFFNAVIPLLTVPYVTQILGREKFGIFSVALNIIVYMQVIVEYGFGMSATRKVALSKQNDFNRLFSAVVTSRLLLASCCVVFAVFYCLINMDDVDLCSSVLVLMICIVGICFQMNWLFQGLQDMKFVSLVNIIARTISMICIFCFVHTKNDLIMYCFLYSISPLIGGLLGFLMSAIKYKVRFVRVTFSDVLKELKDGFFVFTTQLSSKVFGAIGITFLGIYAPYAEVGVFSAIQKVTNIMILVWTPISQVLYPISAKRVTNDFFEGKRFVYKAMRYILPVFIVLAVLVAIFAKPLITRLFGAEYAEYYYWIFPLLIWMILAIINNFLGIQIMLGGGFDKEYGRCFQIGVACTVFLNFCLVYFMHGNGASLAPAISEFVLGVMLIIQLGAIKKRLVQVN